MRAISELKCDFGSVKKIFRFRHISLRLTCLTTLQEMPIICLWRSLCGDTQLGYYDKAYKLALYPEQNLTHVITPGGYTPDFVGVSRTIRRIYMSRII